MEHKMKINDVLSLQMNVNFNEESWFIPLFKAVDGITEKQAEWKPGESTNSIKEIVTHLLYWNKYYFDKFVGNTPRELDGNNNTTFTRESLENKEMKWLEIVDQLKTLIGKWTPEINKASEEKITNPEHKWMESLANTNVHNAYHIGQIVYLKKVQGLMK